MDANVLHRLERNRDDGLAAAEIANECVVLLLAMLTQSFSRRQEAVAVNDELEILCERVKQCCL